MYTFGRQFAQDPFGPDPYGPDYEKLMNPTQNLQGFQFSQNPATPDVAPPMGIGLGGVPETPNYMGFMAGGQGAPSGAGMASGLMAAGKMLGAGGNEQQAPSAQAGRGSPIQQTMLNWDFWDALNEMKQNKRRR